MFQDNHKPIARGSVTFHGTLMEARKKPRWLEVVQHFVITGVLLAIAIVIFGVPYLRWDRELIQPKDGDQLSADNLTVTRYVGLGGEMDIRAGEFSDGLPRIVLVPIWRVLGKEQQQEI